MTREKSGWAAWRIAIDPQGGDGRNLPGTALSVKIFWRRRARAASVFAAR